MAASLALKELSSKLNFKGEQIEINFLLHALVRVIYETHCRWNHDDTRENLLAVIDDLESIRYWMFLHGIDPEDLFDFVELMSSGQVKNLDEFACSKAVITRSFWRLQAPAMEPYQAEFLAKSWAGYIGD